MYDRHEESTGSVSGPAATLFDHLDDQTLMSAHMNKRSWKMGWGKMDLSVDERRGQAVGSRIVLDGRVLGIRLRLEEVVTERVPPIRKAWETIGEPRLLVIGRYRMEFELTPTATATRLRVAIDYDLPRSGFARLLGVLLGRAYAKWCTRRMVQDALAVH